MYIQMYRFILTVSNESFECRFLNIILTVLYRSGFFFLTFESILTDPVQRWRATIEPGSTVMKTLKFLGRAASYRLMHEWQDSHATTLPHFLRRESNTEQSQLIGVIYTQESIPGLHFIFSTWAQVFVIYKIQRMYESKVVFGEFLLQSIKNSN